MAYESLGYDQTFVAEEDLSDYQFHCVKLGAAEKGVIKGSAACMVLGILMNNPESGLPATVRTAPGIITKVKAGDVIVFKDTLESDADGEVVAFTINGDGATETWLVGIALQAAAAANVLISILTKFCPAQKT